MREMTAPFVFGAPKFPGQLVCQFLDAQVADRSTPHLAVLHQIDTTLSARLLGTANPIPW